MRFAIDIIDDAGNNRIYIGEPLGLAGDKLRVQLRDREAMFEIERIADWFQIDQTESRGRGELFC
ncbi:hypothetical protein J5N58_19780 [Rhizobium cremeum]|uniref:hypothetical protein n=1 Tax=Rhizobium cremeum TaxID=2813827 RepID=UPI000DDBDA0B|nr:hypothetical protein [Rhizobium cremeum]MCJ7997195.1 hypothetical protein [Rhizobium cremeum]MCJ8001927.1 hypothetical protein [Rhizobium cremeum]